MKGLQIKKQDFYLSSKYDIICTQKLMENIKLLIRKKFVKIENYIGDNYEYLKVEDKNN